MRDIKGYNIDEFDLDSLSLIADLIYFEGPLLSHYASPQGDNYLFYWVDSDDECNRWMIIKINLQIIQDYISQKITLFSLIRDRADKSVYMVDLDNNLNVCRFLFVNIVELPDEYFPEEESYYCFEPKDSCDLSVLSKKYNQGVFELKITGEGVDYGTMPLEKLSTIISGFEGVRKTLAEDFIKCKKRYIRTERERCKNEPQTESVKKKLESLQAQESSLLLDTSYNTIYRAAGSFRILFMPKNLQLNLWPEKSIADEFASEVMEFISAGEDIELLRDFSQRYNTGIVKKLENFVVGINKDRLNVGIKWYDDRINNAMDYQIPYCKTSHIIDNLSIFEYDNTEDLLMTGRFYMVNLKNGQYHFEDDFGKSSGCFAEQVVGGIYSIGFNKIYKVKIKRHSSQPVGKSLKINDVLESYLEFNE